MHCSRIVPASTALLILSCAGPGGGAASIATPVADADRPAWEEPPIERCVSVRDGATGAELSFDELLDRLAEADAVFLGETHIDETTHRVEQAVYEGLLSRRDGKVVLALEMFERDVQEHLDAYTAGDIDEETFLDNARPWQNYRTAYRPLIERARADGRRVLASNFPRALMMQVAMGGAEALADAPPGQAPAELFPNSPEYHRRTDNAVRGHLASMRSNAEGDDERLFSTQTLWDNAMGDTCARALAENPGHAVLHVNGGFHSGFWDGTVRQFRLRDPDARVLTVDIAVRTSPRSARLVGVQESDFTVFAEARASDLNEGTWAVAVQRELDWRLHLASAARDGAPVPLLIWLGDDGLTAEDGLALWRARLGDECALAVVEPPYRALQEDLSEGGRWFWPDTFAEDVDSMMRGLERIWGYALRHYPVDPGRVVLAGEGTGATVAAAATLLTTRMSVSGVALGPRRYSKVRDFPLPLPEYRDEDSDPERSLRLLVGSADADWWEEELAAYRDVGLDALLERSASDPWAHEVEQENALRTALGLPVRDVSHGDRRHVLPTSDAPRARHWTRLFAMAGSVDGASVAVLESPPRSSRFPRPPPTSPTRFRAVPAPSAARPSSRCPRTHRPRRPKPGSRSKPTTRSPRRAASTASASPAPAPTGHFPRCSKSSRAPAAGTCSSSLPPSTPVAPNCAHSRAACATSRTA
jgi:uncharacterized iron-regulated protein